MFFRKTRVWALLVPLFLAACVTDGAGVKIGGGSSGPVSGSAADGASTGTAELQRCAQPIATVALSMAESQNVQMYIIVNNQPASPLPAMRLIAQQTNCFRIVNRDVALQNIEAERRLERAGELRRGSNFGGGQIVAADYTMLVEVMVSNPNASGSRVGAGLASFGWVGMIAGAVAAGNQTHEATVLLTLVDNRTSIQLTSATGKASGRSYNIGGIFAAGGAGVGGAIGAGGYENTDQGKVVMGAMVDAMNTIRPSIPPRAVN